MMNRPSFKSGERIVSFKYKYLNSITMKKNVSLNNTSTEALQQLIKTGTALNYAPVSIRKYKLPMVMSRAEVQQLFSGCLKEKGKK